MCTLLVAPIDAGGWYRNNGRKVCSTRSVTTWQEELAPTRDGLYAMESH